MRPTKTVTPPRSHAVPPQGPVGSTIIDEYKYQVFFTDDPDCPVLLKRVAHIEELGHKGRSKFTR